MKRISLAITAIVSLTACQMEVDNTHGDSALDMASVVLGESKAHILECAGPPKHRANDGGVEVWTYQYDWYKTAAAQYDDQAYIGITKVFFTDGQVSNVDFFVSPDRNTLGMKAGPRTTANINKEILKRC